MSMLQDGLGGYLVLAAVALLAHEPWRWLGLYLGRNLDADGELFRWVRAVATALVAALVTRLILFPAGALEGVAPWARLVAFAAGLGVFAAAGRHVGAGILGGAAVLAALELAAR